MIPPITLQGKGKWTSQRERRKPLHSNTEISNLPILMLIILTTSVLCTHTVYATDYSSEFIQVADWLATQIANPNTDSADPGTDIDKSAELTGGWFNELDVWTGAPKFEPEVLETPGHYALAGLVELIAYQRTGNPTYLNEATYVANYLLDAQSRSASKLTAEGLSIGGLIEYYQGVAGGKWTSRSNDGIAMWFLVEMYKQTGNTGYLDAAKAIADFNFKEPRLRNQGEADGKYPQLSTNNLQLVGGHTGDFGFSFGAGTSIINYLEANMLRGLNALRSVDPSYNPYFMSTAEQLARMQLTSGDLDYYWTINFGDVNNPDDDTFTPTNKEATRANSAAKDLREAGKTLEANKLIDFIISQQQPNGAIYSPKDGHAKRIRGNARSAIALIENGKIEEGTKVLDFILTTKLGTGQYPDYSTSVVLSHYSTAWVGIALSLLGGAERAAVPAGATTTVGSKDLGVSADVTTTTGTPTVTVATYTSNPGGTPTFSALGKYVDVQIDNAAGVTQILIKVYYTDAEVAASGITESTLKLYWWTGSAWVACSDTGVDTVNNYIWARITATSTPNLNQLTGTPFGAGGVKPAPVGGYVVPVSKVSVLAPYLALFGIAGAAAVVAVKLRRRKA
ncbi:MAG: hypothetical protein QXN62_01735 [Candidatus Bathyarchaeia archaeon]